MTENSAIFAARHGAGSFHPHRQPAPTAQACLKRQNGANRRATRQLSGEFRLIGAAWGRHYFSRCPILKLEPGTFGRVLVIAGANSLLKIFFSAVLTVLFCVSAQAAQPVSAFIDSVCINSQVGQGTSPPNMITMLNYSGIRCVRGRSNKGDATPYLQISASVPGVKFNIFSVHLDYAISTGHALDAANALLSFEGPNEPNNFKFAYPPGSRTFCGGRGSTDWTPCASYMRDYYAALKADAALNKYPVFNLTEPGAEPNNMGLQCASITSQWCIGALFPIGTVYADYLSDHNYANGVLIADNFAWIPAGQKKTPGIDGFYAEHISTWGKHFKGYTAAQAPGVNRVTTETGWHTATTCRNYISEVKQGSVLLDIWLAQFTRGWSYTFVYQIQDGTGGDTCNYGIFHNDLTPKPAATSIGNMLSILRNDVGANVNLNYSLGTIPSTVHSLALTPGIIIVWDERATASDSVTLSFPVAHSYNLYDPTVGTAKIGSGTAATHISLVLSDHPQIIRLWN
jgi:hypothetical protein